MSEKVNVSFEDLDSAISSISLLGGRLLRLLNISLCDDMESSGKCADALKKNSDEMIKSVFQLMDLMNKTITFLEYTKKNIYGADETVADSYKGSGGGRF